MNAKGSAEVLSHLLHAMDDDLESDNLFTSVSKSLGSARAAHLAKHSVGSLHRLTAQFRRCFATTNTKCVLGHSPEIDSDQLVSCRWPRQKAQ